MEDADKAQQGLCHIADKAEADTTHKGLWYFYLGTLQTRKMQTQPFKICASVAS
jgi:hypothetical protein